LTQLKSNFLYEDNEALPTWKERFAEVSKSLVRYRSENNFICIVKIIT